jgi:flagellin
MAVSIRPGAAGLQATGGTSGASITDLASALSEAAFTTGNYPGVTVNVPTYPWEASTTYSANIDVDIAACDAAITSLRSTAAEMGANIAILEVRNAYTKASANILIEGAAKLMNADLNEEGANMVALQTRTQLGIQALSFSGKTAQGILQLFR